MGLADIRRLSGAFGQAVGSSLTPQPIGELTSALHHVQHPRTPLFQHEEFTPALALAFRLYRSSKFKDTPHSLPGPVIA